MLYLWSTILVLLNAFCLLMVLFSMPGNWLIITLTCLFAWWRWDDGVFSVYTLVAIAILAVLGELIEFLGGAGTAKKAGATWRGSVGALIGAITGALIGTFVIPVPVLGTLIGACIGAGLGTWALELSTGRDTVQSARYGVAAGIGQFLGITGKFVIGIVIWLIVTVAAFWP